MPKNVQSNTETGDKHCKRVILPASHYGSTRWYRKKNLESLAIVQKHGKPNLFITMTCNPNHPQILAALPPQGRTGIRKLWKICFEDPFITLTDTAAVEADEIEYESAGVHIDKFKSAGVRIEKYESAGVRMGKYRSADVRINKYNEDHVSMDDSENVFTPDIVSTGVGGENQIRMVDSHDLPRLTSKRDDCCVLIDAYNTSADVRIDKYDSADVRVYKYDLPSNGTSPTTTAGVEEEIILLTTTTGVEEESKNVSNGKTPPALIDRGKHSDNQSEYIDEEDFGSRTPYRNTQSTL